MVTGVHAGSRGARLDKGEVGSLGGRQGCPGVKFI